MSSARDDAVEALLFLRWEELAEDVLPLLALRRELFNPREKNAALLLCLLVRFGERYAAHAFARSGHRRLGGLLHRRGEARDLLVHQRLVVHWVPWVAAIEVLLQMLVRPKALVADAAAVHGDALGLVLALVTAAVDERKRLPPLLLRRFRTSLSQL